MPSVMTGDDIFRTWDSLQGEFDEPEITFAFETAPNDRVRGLDADKGK
jgi:hypothetical protein